MKREFWFVYFDHNMHRLSCPLFWSQITVQDILEFEKKYKGSDEERQDVIQLYVQHQGDIDAIMASVLCCSQEDEPRLCSIIQEAIQSGAVAAFKAFTQEGEGKKKARRKRVRGVLVLKQEILLDIPARFGSYVIPLSHRIDKWAQMGIIPAQ